MPQPCRTYFESQGPRHIIRRKSIKWILGISIICLILLAIFLFCCYKHYLKRQITRELSLKANIAVSEYFAMHDNGEKDSKRLIELSNA